VFQHVSGQMSARADTDDMRVSDTRFQLVVRQGFGVIVDLAIARPLKGFHSGTTDAFEQQHLDVLLGVRGFHGGRMFGCPNTMPDFAAMQH
jgi:hypothetical protein